MLSKLISKIVSKLKPTHFQHMCSGDTISTKEIGSIEECNKYHNNWFPVYKFMGVYISLVNNKKG